MITRKDVFIELISPNDFAKVEENKTVSLAIYKAVYMGVRLLLDIRSNQVQLAKQMGYKLESNKDNVPTT